MKDGKFGAMMQVHIQNDGPVTVEIESPRVVSVDGISVRSGVEAGSQADGKVIGVVRPLQE